MATRAWHSSALAWEYGGFLVGLGRLGSSGGLREIEWVSLTGGLERDGGVVDQKSPVGGSGPGQVGIAGEGVHLWEPEIRWYRDDMVGDTLMGGSSSSGELSLGSVSDEESEFWVRRCSSLIRHMMGVGHSERDSWSV